VVSRYVLMVVAVAGLLAPTGRAEVFQDVPLALGFAGFDFIGTNNPLSGGVDFLATSDFNNRRFDFGATDLTLDGPLSLQISTGGRALSQFDVSLTTAPNARTNADPLNYILNSDVGGQSTQIDGNLLMDADFSLNGFGFYDLNVTYSSRQNVNRDGRFANDSDTFDSDIGPITVSGNIYADGLALLTDPLFERSGRPNPFEDFSNASPVVDARLARAVDLRRGGRPSVIGPPPHSHARPGAGPPFGVVPEPTVLLLMLLGIPAMMAKPLRNRLRSR